jgi:O-methyltransferase
VFLKGWFKDTLPTAPIQRIAVMRLDGDMYESTMDGLTNLYPKLSKGGFCIIDDYGLDGCKKAVDDFRQQHGITAELKRVDWTGSYWRKD